MSRHNSGLLFPSIDIFNCEEEIILSGHIVFLIAFYIIV